MPLYRPPAEADNLIIQATLGCSFNQCGFCARYRGKQNTERALDAVFADIHRAAAQYPDAHCVFFAGSRRVGATHRTPAGYPV